MTKEIANEIINAKPRAGAPLKTMVVGIDSGFGRVKIAYKDSAKGKVKTDHFSASMVLGRESLDVEETLYINGVPCDVMADEKITDKGYITKENEYNITNMYRALYKIYQNTKTTNFVVGLGCSLDTYKSKDAVESLKAKALEHKEIKFSQIGKEDVILTIEDVFIQPETACSIFNLEKDVNPNAINYIIDLGTLNSQIIKYQKAPDVANSRPRNFGYASITKKIADKFRSLGKNFDEKTVEYFIENLDEQTSSIQKVIKSYIINEFLKETLTDELIKANVNLDVANLIFVGGTSARFATQIAKVFKDCKFAQNPLFANVIGMYLRTEKMYSNKLKNQQQKTTVTENEVSA